MAAEATVPILLIRPAIVIGLAIGIYESLLLHRDVTVPTHRFGHMIQAIGVAIIAVFATMNVPFVYQIFPQLLTVSLLGNILFFRIAVGLIMMLKIHGISAALKSRGMATHGMAETWFHSLLIAALVVAAPYIWPSIAPFLPAWAGGTTPAPVK